MTPVSSYQFYMLYPIDFYSQTEKKCATHVKLRRTTQWGLQPTTSKCLEMGYNRGSRGLSTTRKYTEGLIVGYIETKSFNNIFHKLLLITKGAHSGVYRNKIF